MNNPGVLVYKCRRCGGIDQSTHAPDVDMAVILTVLDMDMPKDWGPQKPHMTCIHNCKDGNTGVCDLIGGEKDKDNRF